MWFRTLTAVVGCLALARPSAGQTTAATDLMQDLSVLAADSMAGRAAGSEGGRMAREYLLDRLAGLGLPAVQDTFDVRRSSGTVEGVNVRVAFDGTAHPERAIVVTAHYDHLGTRDGEVFNGADDNASGTVGLLALAEWLEANPPRHDVHLVFTDAEEGGLQGARAFVADPPVALDAIVFNLNLDMISHSDGDLWVAGTYPWPALAPIVEAVDAVSPVELRFGHDTPADQGADNWVMASDHGPFHQAGIPFLYFGVADHPDYHQSSDDVDTVNPDFFRAAVETIRRVLVSADRTLAGERVTGR